MSRMPLIACIVFCFCFVFSSQNAVAISFAFYGKIDVVENYSTTAPSGIDTGTSFLYIATLDKSSKPIYSKDNYDAYTLQSSYLRIGKIFYGDIAFKTLGVYDNYSILGYDKIEFDQSGWLDQYTGAQGYYFANIQFVDYSGKALSSTSIPESLSGFDFSFYLKAFGSDSTGGDKYALRGTVNYVKIINPVPEPSTLLLLASGLVGLALYNRKRKKT